MRRSVRWGEATKGGFRLQERTNKREATTGGYKSVQTKERLQATRVYKQKKGFRLQERTNKRKASSYKSVQTKERLPATRAYKQKRLRWGATRAYNKEGVVSPQKRKLVTTDGTSAPRELRAVKKTRVEQSAHIGVSAIAAVTTVERVHRICESHLLLEPLVMCSGHLPLFEIHSSMSRFHGWLCDSLAV